MHDIKPPILKYNKQKNVFFLDSNETRGSWPAKIFGSTLVRLTTGKSIWTFPAWYPNGYLALKDFKALYPDGQATEEAIYVINALKVAREAGGSIPEDYSFKVPPYVHQVETLELMLKSQNLALLLEMGLGKTYISINYIAIKKFIEGTFKSLIVAPKKMLDNWGYELEDFTVDLTYLVYKGTPKKREKLRNKFKEQNLDVMITNYEILVSDKEFFNETRFACLIVDEASRIKGHKSARSKAILQIGGRIPYRFILSGAMSLGTPLDVYTPYSLLNGDILGRNYWWFKNKFCRYSPYDKHIVIGYKNLDLLKSMIDPFSIILNKEDCLSLPERTFGTHKYRLTEEQLNLYNRIVREDEVRIDKDSIPTNLAFIKINKLLQILSGFLIIPPSRENPLCGNCGLLLECIKQNTFPWDEECVVENDMPRPKRKYHHLKEIPKLDLLKEDILSLSRGAKVCVWAYYQQDIVNIRNMLTNENIPHIVFEKTGQDREFQENPSIKVFLGQSSTGIGVTLTSATTTIFYSHSLKLEDRLQPLDRNYRIGQKEKVHVIDYVGRYSIEESIVDLLNKKHDIRNFIHQNMDKICLECSQEKVTWCTQRGIRPYSRKCKYNEDRETLEEAKHLLIDTVYY